MKQSTAVFVSDIWKVKTLKRITEKKFLEAIWGSGNKTHHEKKKNPKKRAYKMAQNLMSVLLTLENVLGFFFFF